MTDLAPKPRMSSVQSWLWTALAVAVAFFFFRAAWEKLVDVPSALAPFVEFGWPLWMADVTAAAEILGAIALIIPRIRPIGGVLLTTIMVAAAVTNIANGHLDYLWVNALLSAGSLLLVWRGITHRHRRRDA